MMADVGKALWYGARGLIIMGTRSGAHDKEVKMHPVYIFPGHCNGNNG